MGEDVFTLCASKTSLIRHSGSVWRLGDLRSQMSRFDPAHAHIPQFLHIFVVVWRCGEGMCLCYRIYTVGLIILAVCTLNELAPMTIVITVGMSVHVVSGRIYSRSRSHHSVGAPKGYVVCRMSCYYLQWSQHV